MEAAPQTPAAAPTQGAVAAFLAALLDHSPDSLRRAGAAVAIAVVPFANAWCAAKLGFSVPESQVLAIEAGLTVYLTQSAVKAFKALGVATPSEEAKP